MARVLTLFCILILIESNAMAVKLTSLIARDAGGKLSITCAFNAPFKYKAYTLSNPARFVLDLENTTTTLNLKNSLTHPALIKRLRYGYQPNHTLRLVFDARDGVMLRAIPLTPVSLRERELRIDVVQMISTAVSTKKAGSRPSLHATNAHSIRSPVPRLHVPSRSLRDVVIVLDAGHGGKDPGAIGMHRSAEKQVVLAIALKLKQLIDRQRGMRAVLTRNGDYYIGLRERMSIARRHNADIFVAIHADAFNNPRSNGASVFALSPRGATSEAARWLAEKENHSELGGVNLSGLDDQNGIIRTVLLDLSQTATIDASVKMGSRVLQGLDTVTTLHNHHVEQARFVVLKSPDIPSILIETGFISNPREEKNLNNPSYQARLTQSIFKGLKDYFMAYPPHGTRLESMAGG